MKDGIKFYSSLDELKFINKDKLPDLIGGKVPSKSITGKYLKSFTLEDFFLLCKKFNSRSLEEKTHRLEIFSYELQKSKNQ